MVSKRMYFSYGEVFFPLTSPLMGDPIPARIRFDGRAVVFRRKSLLRAILIRADGPRNEGPSSYCVVFRLNIILENPGQLKQTRKALKYL